MDWDGGKITRDEQAVLDHVSGLSRSLGAPEGEPCADRAVVGELMALRAKVGSLAITPPKLRLKYEDILRAAQNSPAQPAPPIPTNTTSATRPENRVFTWLTSRWGIGLVTAASIALTVVAGAYFQPEAPAFNGQGQVTQFPVRGEDSDAQARWMATDSARSEPARNDFGTSYGKSELTISGLPQAMGDARGSLDSAGQPSIGLPAMVRTGSIYLRHADPAQVQYRVTDLVTAQGGSVTSLNRQGAGAETQVTLQLAVPSTNWRAFIDAISAMGEVINQTESADEVTAQQVDLKATLAEATDYLARLDALAAKPASSLSETQSLERERRDARHQIERLKAALAALENRISLSRLTLQITATTPVEPAPPGPFADAWEDGLTGLTNLSAFALRAGVAGSPLLLAATLIILALRHKRRKTNAA